MHILFTCIQEGVGVMHILFTGGEAMHILHVDIPDGPRSACSCVPLYTTVLCGWSSEMPLKT